MRDATLEHPRAITGVIWLHLGGCVQLTLQLVGREHFAAQTRRVHASTPAGVRV